MLLAQVLIEVTQKSVKSLRMQGVKSPNVAKSGAGIKAPLLRVWALPTARLAGQNWRLAGAVQQIAACACVDWARAGSGRTDLLTGAQGEQAHNSLSFFKALIELRRTADDGREPGGADVKAA